MTLLAQQRGAIAAVAIHESAIAIGTTTADA